MFVFLTKLSARCADKYEQNQFQCGMCLTLLIPYGGYRFHFCSIKKQHMRAKSIADLVSLSVSLYLLLKDEALFHNETAEELKSKISRIVDEITQALYEKMHIAHTAELNVLKGELETLRTELALMEAKVINLQQQNG